MRTRTVHRGIRTVAVLASLSLAAAACSDDAGPPAASGGDNPFFAARSGAPVALEADRSCGEVLEGFQAFATTVLADQATGFAMGGDDMAVEDSAEGSGAAGTERSATASSAPAAAEASDGDATGGTSATNTQEEGIDEPDVVETDGDHVYLVDQEDLVVLDGATGDPVSRTRLASYGSQLLLQGDRLLVISGGMGYGIQRPMPIEDGAATGVAVDPNEGGGSGSIDPAPLPLPVDPPQFAAGTVLQLLDVSDPAAPQVLQTTELEGSHITTRVVDGVASVVITSWPDVQPMYDDVVMEGGASRSVGAAAASVEAAVAETEIGDWLPAFRTTVVEGDEPVSEDGTVVGCEDVLMPEVNAGISQTSILRVDFADGFDPADTTTVVADSGTVYASARTLYLAATRYLPVEERQDGSFEASTAVHAFDLAGDGPAAHAAAGEVPGFVLNQYSLSEHDGHLRIATTEDGGGTESQSGVRVLRRDGGELVEVGAVTGLGLTETIQSVRFMGPVGYVVTFRQTDPLYVIDLSDPAAPRAVGELKIPGFSSYLHPVGEGRLVGIGRDADEQGRDRGLLVSLFDVSDPTAPAQLQTWTERDGWSQAGADPKAFLYWSPESAVVVPVERYASVDGSGREIGQVELGMVVLDVADDGITERATVTAEGRYPSRALVVQDRLWSLFDGGVVVSDFDDPAAGVLHPYR